jgi:hypothetical protein
MKVRQYEISNAIIDADEDILLIPQTTGLVANQREYSFPNDMVSNLKRVEAKLDGTNWLKLSNIDLTSLPQPTDETHITYYFSNDEGNCFYHLLRKSIYIFSGTITTVAAGLKAWFNTYPTAITNLASTTDMSNDPSSTSNGVPRELHEIWARGVIIDYKESREKPIPLTEREKSYKTDLEKSVYSLKPQDLDRSTMGNVPDDDGSDY